MDFGELKLKKKRGEEGSSGKHPHHDSNWQDAQLFITKTQTSMLPGMTMFLDKMYLMISYKNLGAAAFATPIMLSQENIEFNRHMRNAFNSHRAIAEKEQEKK